MSNPFTAPTLSGYNASPPADDGSATDANTIKWATHIDKIGDPLRTYAQAISSNVSTAFGKMFGNDFAEKTANYTVATSDQGKMIVATTAALTFTLPAAASAGSNFCVMVKNSSAGSLTIDGNSSETINGDTTLVLPYAGQSAILVCDSSSWYALVADGDNGEQEHVLAAAATFTNDTTLADVFQMTSLRANRWYEFEASFTYAQTGGDIKLAGTFSQTPQTIGPFMIEAISESGDYYVVVDADISSGANSITTMTDADNVSVRVRGVFQTNATTGGDFDLQAAQATSDSDATTIAAKGRAIVRDLAA